MNPSSIGDGALQSLTRLVRRICLLTEQGDEAEAVRLENTQLAEAIRQLRHDHGPDALTEQHLSEIFIAEQRRAADAVALAELLIPQLTRPPASGGRAAAAGNSAASRTGRQAAPAQPPAAPSPRGIPEFLDAMFAANAPHRTRLLPVPPPTNK